MAEILLVSLCIGFLLIEVFSLHDRGYHIHSYNTSFSYVVRFCSCFLQLVISVIIPVIRILKIHPAEVIS